MRRLPWHVSIRADRKALFTAAAIALAVAFSVLGFALAGALEGESIAQDGRFSGQEVVIGRGGEPFDASSLAIEPTLRVLLVEGARRDGAPVTLVGLEGASAPTIERGTARPGASAGMADALDLVEPAPASFAASAALDHPHADPRWVALDPVELRELAGLPAGAVTYVLAEPPSARALDALRAQGYTASFVPSVEPFFRASGMEVARDLLLLVAFSSILVGLFSYEFLRSEIHERRRDIGLWRSLGMRVRDVEMLLVGRGAFIVSLGALFGYAIALGALEVLHDITGSGIFRGALSPLTALVLLASFVGAGIAGAALPALAAARQPVRAWLEAEE